MSKSTDELQVYPEIVREVLDGLRAAAATLRQDLQTDQVIVNGELTSVVVVARCVGDADRVAAVASALRHLARRPTSRSSCNGQRQSRAVRPTCSRVSTCFPKSCGWEGEYARVNPIV